MKAVTWFDHQIGMEVTAFPGRPVIERQDIPLPAWGGVMPAIVLLAQLPDGVRRCDPRNIFSMS